MHNQAMTMVGPRLKQPRFNTKKKLMIYIALAATYLIVVMVAGLVMDPEMYGVHYEDSFLAPSLAHPFGTDIMGRDMFWRSVKGLSNSIPVSYTHLDVYKRQSRRRSTPFWKAGAALPSRLLFPCVSF